jgi:proteasome lid subunit RPN8/RPN11
MLQLHREHVEQIRAEAKDCYPEEGVWLITEKGCRQVANIHPDPEGYFDVSAADVTRARKEGLLAIVHSHTNGLHYPSVADMQSQINTDVPWGLLITDGEDSSWIRWWGGKTPDQVEDLLDRTFCHATADCYALVRDYYLVNFGIRLKEFPRGWRWWDDQNLLAEGFGPAGFSVVKDQPRAGDVWLASFSSKTQTVNHCGVLLDNNLTHHHPGAGTPINATKKAVIEPIFRYLPHIQLWVRHKDLA